MPKNAELDYFHYYMKETLIQKSNHFQRPSVDMDVLLYAWAEGVGHVHRFRSFGPLRSTFVHDSLSAYRGSNLS